MFATFEARAKDGFVSKEDFPVILASLFDDVKHEQVALLLESAYFMDRVFDFLNQGKKGKLSHEDFERVGKMFSSDTNELIEFRFFVYDVGSKAGTIFLLWFCFDFSFKGYITKVDMTKMVRTIFETNLTIREHDLEDLAKKDQAEAGALDKFRKAKEQFLARADVVDAKIGQIVNFAFETTVRKDDGKITFAEFSSANLKNDDLFDWRGLAEDLTDHVDDLSRLV
jgi:hypothetical protein